MSLGAVPQAMSQAVASQKARDKEKTGTQNTPPSSSALNGAALSPLSSIVGSQIRFLVANLNKKNYKASSEEVKHVRLFIYYSTNSQFVKLLIPFLVGLNVRPGCL